MFPGPDLIGTRLGPYPHSQEFREWEELGQDTAGRRPHIGRQESDPMHNLVEGRTKMNTKPKAAEAKKPQVKVRDLKPKKDVKGGKTFLPANF